jgi:hypothetical protein
MLLSSEEHKGNRRHGRRSYHQQDQENDAPSPDKPILRTAHLLNLLDLIAIFLALGVRTGCHGGASFAASIVVRQKRIIVTVGSKDYVKLRFLHIGLLNHDGKASLFGSIENKLLAELEKTK